ncbi:MAG: cation:proton antiporter subunit C [Nitrospira sp.]|nr:cation:proton antiporter subunit C [Nitrospira sp.]MCB9710215.1 cation:proton antiporter subunit C [Nitrospiraceae bacterium]MDR4486608.1 cation:proton antiporter subunit C [Nitrospirales bacterium]MCA9466731.1 cation:proton antiporter subunit C [Nitrospira sp.]MCA9475416.1 cation:proton antiporter subunit C [Nitrospira sp.]
MFELVQGWLQRPNYFAFVLLFLWGIYIMVTRYNLVKKLIGMYLMQTSVIFFFVTVSYKEHATVPILIDPTEVIRPEIYANPLPHVLTLTAIVVGVATLGVSLALADAIYKKYGSLDEEDILKKLE